MPKECKLSTIDNPFDPFEQFDDWLRFDEDKGYNCCSYLARIAKLTDDMTPNEEDVEIERAIDEILTLNPTGLYKKVTRSE